MEADLLRCQEAEQEANERVRRSDSPFTRHTHTHSQVTVLIQHNLMSDTEVKGQDDLTKYGRSDITLYYSDITPECSQSGVDAAAPTGTMAAVGLQSGV